MSYGFDLSCTDSLETSRFVYGIELVGQALYRRLTTERGTLGDSPDAQAYGTDLPGLIGSAVNEQLISALPARVENECRKDPRVLDVRVSMTRQTEQVNTVIQFDIAVTLQDEETTFVLSVLSSGVSAELLGIV